MSNKFLIESSDEFNNNLVGIKAINLFNYKLITPEFIVLTSTFYKEWSKKSSFIKKENRTLSQISAYFQKRDYKQIILRSSCTSEDIANRGRYLSVVSRTSVDSIRTSLLTIFKDFQKASKANDGLAIIVQAYKMPKMQGHLSNERRVDIDKRVWLIEKEFAHESEVQVDKIQVSNSSNVFDYSINRCLNTITLDRNLRFLASWFVRLPLRYHIEWLWDGVNFWIAQIDEEPLTKKSTKPGRDWLLNQKTRKSSKGPLKDLEILETISTTRIDWPKTQCLKTFSDCGLPFWDIYILENSSILASLSKGEVDLSLASDLKKILKTPIILRSDIRKSDGPKEKFEVLLPRTETIFDYSRAIEFIKENAKRFREGGLKSNQYCFLIHQFIPSMAGALSYAKPNLDRVRIDATWGIVEGLYFHPHDSFELKILDGKISRKLRRKDKYVDFDKDGNWYSKEAGTNFDWKQSLTDKQIRVIGRMTQQIADHLRKPVTVMFFINDKNYYPEILPWIYSVDEIPESDTNYTNVIFSNNRYIIKSKEDFFELKKIKGDVISKAKLLLKLNTELSRDKQLIEDIASFAKKKNYVVDIEGSILSHPYYVLYSKGVHVRCVDPLESHYGQKEFHKLVRDKIPVLIQNNKEEVLATNVSPNELLQLLKEKAVEEALELYWSKNNDSVIEELSDLLEVIIGTCKAYGVEFDSIEKIAERKREKRGGFEKGIMLVATKENSLFQLVTKKNTLFYERQNEIDDVKLRPVIKFFQKGEISNYKSLTEVDKIHLNYINNLASKANSFRYLLKKDEYNSILVEYKEKEIVISFEKANLEVDPNQLKLFATKSNKKK